MPWWSSILTSRTVHQPAGHLVREPGHLLRRSSCRASGRAASIPTAPACSVPILEAAAWAAIALYRAVAHAGRRHLAEPRWLGRQPGGRRRQPPHIRGPGRDRLRRGRRVHRLAFQASVDGFGIQGGDQQGFPNNINEIGGGRIPGVPAEVVIQGGGIFVNGYASHLRITNNVIQSNGGAYAGAIRLGTPDMPVPLSNQNDDIFIAHNRILANGGTNLAGAIGVFAGTLGYEIAYNDICGNFSVEYGGGISHYGLSPGGSIHHNRIYFNRAYDEGGGIMIAGELPANPDTTLSPGAGPVDIYANLIQGNLSNDDGGGLRFLMAGTFPSTSTTT